MTKDLRLRPIARTAEVPRKSVGPGFELGRWFFLGAATGSPYIVFILRQSYGFMLRIYIYIYIYI